ncbi:hypothetical protein FRC12_009713 [Ceratobasidium sp. 428]|nr:hypothetical protein FRC12_009713 [Ceratobasidium sp. 428]
MSKPTIDPARDPGAKPKPRKLIVCIDGTSNQFSENVNTNVVELYSRITKDPTQLTYYNSGIGTYARPFRWSPSIYLKQKFMSIMDLTLAWNFDQVIIGAYRWLADNHEPGDQIWLFGFSRGAYQVRTLAGMIEKVGLIHPGNQEQIPFAWAIYSGNEPDSKKLSFKETFCRKKVDLHFVGVWDTVASVGFRSGKPFPLSDEGGHITHFRHALALDERRVKFLPEHIKPSAQGEQSQEEVWFAGTHSDIGGGNKANPTLDRGGEPLKWMMEEAYEQGLSVRLHDVKIGVPHAEVTNSLRANSTRGLLYNFLEIVPFLGWKEYLSSGESRSNWRSHSGSPREVLPHQSIHWTVNASRSESDPKNPGTTVIAYTPKALILDGDVQEKKDAKETPTGWNDLNVLLDEGQSKLLSESEARKLEERRSKLQDKVRYGQLPSWTDDYQCTRMVDILKTRPEVVDKQWFARLNDYALGEDPGKPDAIWAYGGPQFLQHLFEAYGDQENTPKIARSIIGFDSKFKPSSPAGGPKSNAKEDEKKREQDLAERLQDMVIPRAILLLEAWAAEYVDSKPPEQNGWRIQAWFRSLFKDEKNADSVDAKWNWDRIPKETRSMTLARVVTDILSEAAKTRLTQVLLNASEKMANSIMVVIHEMTGRETPIESAASWEKDKANLAEGALNVIMALMNLGNEAPRDVFHEEGTASAIRPLIRAKEKHPELSLQAMRTAALLSQDLYCGIDLSSPELISDLLGMMHDHITEDELVKQQLANEASVTLATLTKHSWCCATIDEESELMNKLFQVFEAGKHVDNMLQIFKNVSTDYPGHFLPEHVGMISGCMDKNANASFALANLAAKYDFDITSWDTFNNNEIRRKATDLLSQQDMQAQAAAQLLRNLIEQESSLVKASGEPLSTSVVLPDVFSALTDSLRDPSRSEQAIDELLATTVRFLLLKPNPGNEIAISELEAEISGLTTLALAGNSRAILAVSAAFTHNEEDKERAGRYMLSLTQMISLEDQKFLKDSMEVATVLVNGGYVLQEFHMKGLMDAIVVIIRAIYAGELFAEDAPLSDWDKEKVTYAAFGLFEALCANESNRKYLTTAGMFETIIILGSTSNYITPDVEEQGKVTVERLTKYEDLIDQIKRLRAQLPKPVGEDCQEEANEVEDNSEDASEDEDETEETSPLIPKD